MTCRSISRAWVVASLTISLAGQALAQSALPLRGTIDEEGAVAPVTSKLAETTLEVSPPDPETAPPTRRANADSDPYAPTGLGNDTLKLYPSITVGSIFSSNVRKSPNNRKSGAGLRIKPDLQLESDWSRHALTVGVEGDAVQYAGHSDLDSATLDLFQRLRIDVRRNTTADINSSYALDKEGGTDATEHSLSGSLAVTQNFGPMSARLAAGTNVRLFEDVKLANGTVEDNDDRNYIEPTLALRTIYNEYGVIKPYAEASYAPRLHTRATDRNGLNRDSTGYGLTAGMQLETGPIWAGDLGLTYLHRNYDAVSLGTAEAFGLTGSLTWSPTELTKIVMATGTSLDETTTAGTPATSTWKASVDMTYALRDNVELTAGAGIEIEDTGASYDKTYDGKVEVEWKFNPILAWSAGYDLTWLDSATAADSYVEHRVSTGLTISR